MNRKPLSWLARRSSILIGLIVVFACAGFVPALVESAGAVAGSPFGRLDSVVAQPPGRSVVVTGWALDPDTKSPISVHIYVDGHLRLAVTANVSRADVAKAYPAYGPLHGYSASIAITGTHTVCTYAMNVGNGGKVNPKLGCRTLTVGSNPIGRLEQAGLSNTGVVVSGWALDPDVTNSLTVLIYADGRLVTTITADGTRNDIAALYPKYGPAHGFATTISLGQGMHTVCARAINLGGGSANTIFGCKPVQVNINPFGRLELAAQVPGAVAVSGWAIDPGTTAAISVATYSDGVLLATTVANGARADIGKDYPAFGPGHGFSTTYSIAAGVHRICVNAINVGLGTNVSLGCATITFNFSPRVGLNGLVRNSAGTSAVLTGWAFDPDTPTSPISVAVTVNGSASTSFVANTSRPDVAKVFKGVGNNHGFVITVPVSAGEHTFCVNVLNVQFGADTWVGCHTLNAIHVVTPAPATAVTALGGYGGAALSWTASASDGGAPLVYTVTANPGGAHASTTGTSASVTGLAAGTRYTFTVVASNIAGKSRAATSNQVITQTAPPPQTTPANISTSRYIRDITGGASDVALMRARGAADAAANPSGHGYLILLHMGGQSESQGGVILSATSHFIPYAQAVTAIDAYVDGYASAQKPSAPAIIAIGTNSDIDVSAPTGANWANAVVDPVVAHSVSYRAIEIAGSDDIEPGFSAGAASAIAWEQGFLGATTAPFVFGGSADGCSWTAINGRCNNGWTAAQLYQLAGGLAPTRILALPQIYNTTMAAQWKYISLTGVTAGKPRVNFAGALTEWTACQQAGGCSSLTGNTAWTAMWNQLRSTASTSPSSLPYSTDLRIN